MILSRHALNLKCILCNKTHESETWPERGDYTSFYFQENKENYYTTIYCPYQDQEWYVVWDDDPGEFIPTGAKRAQRLDQHTLSKTKVMVQNPIFFKSKVRETDITIEPEVDLPLYGDGGYNNDRTSNLLISTEYSIEKYEEARRICLESKGKCIELSMEEYSKIYHEYEDCPSPENLLKKCD